MVLGCLTKCVSRLIPLQLGVYIRSCLQSSCWISMCFWQISLPGGQIAIRKGWGPVWFERGLMLKAVFVHYCGVKSCCRESLSQGLGLAGVRAHRLSREVCAITKYSFDPVPLYCG